MPKGGFASKYQVGEKSEDSGIVAYSLSALQSQVADLDLQIGLGRISWGGETQQRNLPPRRFSHRQNALFDRQNGEGPRPRHCRNWGPSECPVDRQNAPVDRQNAPTDRQNAPGARQNVSGLGIPARSEAHWWF